MGKTKQGGRGHPVWGQRCLLVCFGELFHHFGVLGHAVGTQAQVFDELGLLGWILDLVITLLQVSLDLLRGHVLHASHLVVATPMVFAAHHAGAIHGAAGCRNRRCWRGGLCRGHGFAGGIGAKGQAEHQGGGQEGLGQCIHGVTPFGLSSVQAHSP